jgi:hypothetical protein
LLLSFLVFHFALHTSNQRFRLLLLPLFLLFAVLSFKQSTYLPFSAGIASIWAQSVALNIVHVISLLFIEKWPAPAPNQAVGSWHSSLRASYRLWSNPQLIFAAEGPSAQAKQESLGLFLFLRLSKLPVYYYLYQHIQPRFFAETIVALRAEDVAKTALLTRLSEVTARQAVVRSYMAVYWIWDNFVLMDGLHAIFATAMVVSGFDQPEDWGRLFGGLEEMCRLRNFWSRFWHRLSRRSYANYGRAVVWSVGHTGLLRSKAVSKAVVALVVFLISGLSHAAVSWQMGWRDWLDVKWFLLNFAACLAETVVLGTVRRVATRVGRRRELAAIEASWLGWFVGYAWVFGFFFWSVPLWQFPRLHRELIKADKWASILSQLAHLDM